MLKRKKVVGQNGIPSEALKFCEGTTRKKLKDILKRVWTIEGFPSEWRNGITVLIFKKRDVEDVKNYRGITLLETAYKVYAAILNKRIKEQIEEQRILSDTRAGFRRGMGINDNVYVLQHVVERELNKRAGKVYALFIDLKAAFDKVRGNKLWEAMEDRGVRNGLIERTKEIYEETVNVIRTNEGETGRFWTEKGVRQGCSLSPTLLTVCIADLEEVLRIKQDGVLVVGMEKFLSLAYADYMVLVADKKREMNAMVKRLERYLDRKGL